MSAALFEMAVHMSMEVCSGNAEERQRYVDWYIKTNGGTVFPIDDMIIPNKLSNKQVRL